MPLLCMREDGTSFMVVDRAQLPAQYQDRGPGWFHADYTRGGKFLEETLCGPYPTVESARDAGMRYPDLGQGPADSCTTCFFSAGSSGRRICRRFPPTPVPNLVFAEWPEVKESDWCGEFKHGDTDS